MTVQYADPLTYDLGTVIHILRNPWGYSNKVLETVHTRAAAMLERSVEAYEIWAPTTAVYPEAGLGTEREVNYLLHGFAGEAGETNNKFKKFLCGSQVTLDANRKIRLSLSSEQIWILTDEIGDTLWYMALLCKALGTPIHEVAKQNVRKLLQRKDEGTLHARLPAD